MGELLLYSKLKKKIGGVLQAKGQTTRLLKLLRAFFWVLSARGVIAGARIKEQSDLFSFFLVGPSSCAIGLNGTGSAPYS